MSGRVRRSGGLTTRADLLMLKEIADENVTWKADLGGRFSYRLWSSETESTIVTPRLKRLVDRGLIGRWEGVGTYGMSGGVELSDRGRDLLDRSILEPLPVAAAGERAPDPGAPT